MTDFVNNGLEGGNNNSSQDWSEQGHSSVFNDPIPVQSEEDDDQNIPVDWMGQGSHFEEEDYSDDDDGNGENGQGANSGASQNGEGTGNGEGTSAEDDFNFDDEEVQTTQSSAEQLSKEELIQKLKEEGYTIEKKEATPESEKERLELEKIDGFLHQANNFINQSNEVVIKEKLKSELADTYRKQNKSHLIGTDEFEIDLEAEYSEYENNPTSQKLMADAIRRDIRDLINKNEAEKKSIVEKREKEVQSKIVENKVKVQDALKGFVKEGAFGVQVTQESAKEIYKFITSGEFTKTVNNDPTLVAKFATYVKNQETIDKNLGGPTYGEGVKAVVDSLGANKEGSSKSPLVHAVNQAQTTNGSSNRKKVWGMPTVEVEKNNDKPFVAGSQRV